MNHYPKKRRIYTFPRKTVISRRLQVGSVMMGAITTMSGAAPVVTVSPGGAYDFAFGSAQAGLSVQSTGQIWAIQVQLGDTQLSPGTDWIIPNSKADGTYDVRATLNSGTTPTGTLGTFLALSSTRQWTLAQSGSGTLTCNLTIEIRKDGGAVIDSAAYDITAEVP